jgi:Rrf2 family nitric oxide-sensitive transcriptional repressor
MWDVGTLYASERSRPTMRLTKSTSHAIRILIDCARGGDRLIKVAVLSERLQITQQNVFKIVNLLAKAGLIDAVRGRTGGVRLARPADAIRIGDIVRAMEVTHVEIESDVPSSRNNRGQSTAGVNQVLDNALVAFIEVLDQHTLADMAGNPVAPRSASRKPVATSTAALYRRPV